MSTVAVCLAGCGFKDGSEIHEAVLAILALDQAGAKIVYCAPDVDQADVVNHLTGSEVDGLMRNVLIESARIARGDIRSVAKVSASDIDALIIPGGFGAAKNLCDFAFKGPECEVNADVESLIAEMHKAGKPIGAICIAPALLARALGARGVNATMTIGNDEGAAGAIRAMGCTHRDCPVDDCVVDEANRVVTTPAYMLGPSPSAVNKGISKLVSAVLEMAK